MIHTQEKKPTNIDRSKMKEVMELTEKALRTSSVSCVSLGEAVDENMSTMRTGMEDTYSKRTGDWAPSAGASTGWLGDPGGCPSLLWADDIPSILSSAQSLPHPMSCTSEASACLCLYFPVISPLA